MRRRHAVLALAVTASVLSGCTAGSDAARPAIFDRTPTAQDVLPADISAGDYVADSIRYVGEDSARGRYWVALLDDGSVCIIADPQAADWAGFCGISGLSGTSPDGATVEFATDPQHLDAQSAELVGDTILVGRP